MTSEASGDTARWILFDRVEIDLTGRRLFFDGQESPLEPKAFAVLALLARQPGRALTRDEILDAVWGQSPDAAQPYQAASDVAGLTAQLRDILAGVPLCEIALDRDVAIEELAGASVTLDGTPLLYAHPDGFERKDPRHLRILGKACEALRASGKKLRVSISCDGVK